MTEEGAFHIGHRQRMKAHFLENGERSFDDHELLELLLYYSVPQGDTNPLAHRLINHFGSLSGVMDASVADLERVKGVGEHTALLLYLLPQFMRRCEEDRVRSGTIVTSVRDASEYLRPCFYGARNEMVYLLCLDAKGRALGCDFLGEGAMCSVNLNLRLLVETALRHRASGVILAHCHVSGVALPSQEDRVVTLHCRKTLQALQIALLDHLVFADGDFVSMVNSGWLPQWGE